MQKDLTHKIIHRNTITLQLNWIFFDNSQNDLCAVDEFVGHIHLSLQQSGYLTVCKHTIQEAHSLCYRSCGYVHCC